MDSKHIRVDKNQQIEKYHPIRFFAYFLQWHSVHLRLLLPCHLTFSKYIRHVVQIFVYMLLVYLFDIIFHFIFIVIL